MSRAVPQQKNCRMLLKEWADANCGGQLSYDVKPTPDGRFQARVLAPGYQHTAFRAKKTSKKQACEIAAMVFLRDDLGRGTKKQEKEEEKDEEEVILWEAEVSRGPQLVLREGVFLAVDGDHNVPLVEELEASLDQESRQRVVCLVSPPAYGQLLDRGIKHGTPDSVIQVSATSANDAVDVALMAMIVRTHTLFTFDASPPEFVIVSRDKIFDSFRGEACSDRPLPHFPARHLPGPPLVIHRCYSRSALFEEGVLTTQ